MIATIKDAVKDFEKKQGDTICVKISLTLQNLKSPRMSVNKNCNLIHQL